MAAAAGEAIVELRKDGRKFASGVILVILLMASYGIVRTPIESAFNGVYGPDRLPLAWIAVGGGATLVLLLYSRLASRRPMHKVYVAAALVFASLLGVLFVAKAAGVPGATFALYIAKDLYVVVLVESFWSLSNLTFTLRGARLGYGLFCAAGAVGAFVAGVSIGSLNDVLAELSLEPWTLGAVSIPLMLLSAWVCSIGFASGNTQASKAPSEGSMGLVKGWQVVRGSSYLPHLLAVIAMSQLAITLTDYQYQTVVFELYPGEHNPARDAVMGQVQAVIEAVAFALQLATGLFFAIVGVPLVMIALPLVLATAVGSFVVVPLFITMAVAKVASKSLDYSLFRAGKEILYLPLSPLEKVQGKAFDMFIYRVAKSVISMLLLFLSWDFLSGNRSLLDVIGIRGTAFFTLATIAAWVALIAIIVPRYRRAQARISVETGPIGEK